MGKAVTITRTDHMAAEVRADAARGRDGAQVRRLLALAQVLEGRPRSAAAAQNGMDRQTLRLNACVQRVHRDNADGIEGLKSRSSPGRAPALSVARRRN